MFFQLSKIRILFFLFKSFFKINYSLLKHIFNNNNLFICILNKFIFKLILLILKLYFIKLIS